MSWYEDTESLMEVIRQQKGAFDALLVEYSGLRNAYDKVQHERDTFERLYKETKRSEA